MMARRHGMLRGSDSHREVPLPLRHLPVRPVMLEEEVEIQHRDMQKLVAENQLVVDDNALLQRELMDVRNEIDALSHIVPELQAEKEMQIRELIHRKLKLEAELRGFEPLKSEVVCLRNEVEELGCLEKELSARVQYLKREMARAQDENRLLGMLEAQIEGLREDIAEARNILEHEKKAKEDQIALRELLEDNLISLARERESLLAELTNTERRIEGIGGSSCDSTNGSPNIRHPASAYGNCWSGALESYNKHDPPRS